MKGGNLKDHPWRISYRTSSLDESGRPLDILQAFYIPALSRSTRYDRVAGYFRSSSLAAASQGLTAFVGHQGKARMVVGADLDPEDVQAILAGDEARMEQALGAELDGETAWPEAERRGVQLLAWLVAHGYLEVRVAFRVHARTGQPLVVTATEDGYVHEKWAVFADAEANRLYASGSLNESRTAWVLNAENIDVHCSWRGASDLERIEEAEIDFQRLWDNKHPSMRVLSLPEAVRQKLVRFAEGISRPLEVDETSAAPPPEIRPSALEQLQFALLKDGPLLPGGRFVGMETAPIAPWPHQAVVARRLIESWPYSYLLCDEVGLGKTIEAGLVFRSLHLSGLAKRILICPPASLTPQWQREMADKFLLSFARTRTGASPRHEYLFPLEQTRSADSIYEPDLVIVSHGLLARAQRQQDLQGARAFDIALVDEAHYARRQNSTQGSRAHPRYGHLFQALRDQLRPKARSLLLATATPMQLDPVEVSDLLTLTSRVGSFQFDPTLTRLYYESLGKIVSGRPLPDSEGEFLRRAVLSARDQDPLLWQFVEEAVIDGRTRLAVRRWLDQGHFPTARADQSGLQRLIFAASPLSRVMLRHSRSLLEIYRQEGRLGANLAKREVLPIPDINFNPLEKQVYVQVERYCTGLAEQIARRSAGSSRGAVGFMLSFLRLRFASSLFAFAETVRRRLERVESALEMLAEHQVTEFEDYELTDFLEDAEEDTAAVCALLKNRTRQDLEWERKELRIMHHTLRDHSGPSSKMKVLLDVLGKRRIAGTGRIRQTVIFTRFFDTLTDIVRRLQQADPGMLIGTYSGHGGQYFDSRVQKLVGISREEVKHRFLRQEIDVLVCTDAAAEGLNLQTADWLVNFDLPWNPMKVEQRIGRIDRIGQRHDTVHVLNLCYVDSAEQVVYGRLLQRLVQAGAIVGTQQISLLPVTMEEFQLLAEKKLKPEELEKTAKERALLFKRRTESMEISARDLFAIYGRLEQKAAAQAVPVTLDDIGGLLAGSAFLRELGWRVLPEGGRGTVIVANLPGVPDGTALTVSRELFEQGLPNLEGGLHFASYGDPVFEQLLRLFDRWELPSGVRRLTVSLPGTDAGRVAYAVACREPSGQVTWRLVKSLSDLQGLAMVEDAEATENELRALQKMLKAETENEAAAALAMARIEQINERAAWSQLLLSYIVIQGGIASRQRLGMAEDGFWKEVTSFEEAVVGRNGQDRNLYIPKIPVDPTARLAALLFDVNLPTVGAEGNMTAPTILLKSAIEAGCRLADSWRVKRTDLTTEDFLGRLSREIRKLERHLA
jgi:superfamily II DNA or RNA helicase